MYIVDGKNMNDKLWERYPLLRDNGIVTIGTYITILNPFPITMKFYNEIPIIECCGGCFVMKKCASVMEIDTDMAITNNKTRSFVNNNVTIDVLSTDVHTTKCSGLFCDRQRAIEISRGNRACGCYSMQSRIGNIVLVHQVSVSKGGVLVMNMDDFSSLEFSDLYMKSAFSSTVRFNILDFTPAYFRLQDCIDNVIDHINDAGGFTVIGWYKRGEINDVSNDDSQNQVESSEIVYHIVSIYQTNMDILNRNEFQRKSLTWLILVNDLIFESIFFSVMT